MELGIFVPASLLSFSAFAAPGSFGFSVGRDCGIPVEGSCPKRELWSVVSTISISHHLEDIEHGKDKQEVVSWVEGFIEETFIKFLTLHCANLEERAVIDLDVTRKKKNQKQ